MQLETVDLNYLVQGASSMLTVLLGDDVELRKDLAGHLPAVQADAGQLTQVLINLTANSRDAMPKGGTLTISTRQVTFDETTSVNSSEPRKGLFVCLTVSDSGAGIAPNILPHIFEPFFTTKEVGKGTGLGLSIVYGAVKQHGGWIEVDSAPDRGTTFRLFLPAAAVPANTPSIPKRPSERKGGNETILLVEDNPSVLKASSLVLQAHGYKVLECASGPDALKLWNQERDGVDVILTDVVMPGGLSGADILRRICEQDRRVKVILTSGYVPDCESIQNAPFLQKPYQCDALLRIIHETLYPTPPPQNGESSVSHDEIAGH
jgi:CheY-like chemotaxis protein